MVVSTLLRSLFKFFLKLMDQWCWRFSKGYLNNFSTELSSQIFDCCPRNFLIWEKQNGNVVSTSHWIRPVILVGCIPPACWGSGWPWGYGLRGMALEGGMVLRGWGMAMEGGTIWWGSASLPCGWTNMCNKIAFQYDAYRLRNWIKDWIKRSENVLSV